MMTFIVSLRHVLFLPCFPFFLSATAIALPSRKLSIPSSSNFLLLVNIPVQGIRLLDAVCLLLGTPFAVVWSQPGVVCSEKVTFDLLTR